MSWTERVHCIPCKGTTDWIVQNGVWTCFFCGAIMSTAQIREYHKTLCSCPPAERNLAGDKCVTCGKGMK